MDGILLSTVNISLNLIKQRVDFLFRSCCVVVWLLSCVCLFVTPRTAACQASLSFTDSSPSLLRFMFTEPVMLSNHLILCQPLSLLPSIFPSIRVFSMSQLFAPNGQSIGASASVIPVESSGLISFGVDWFNLLAIQGTLKSLQHHSSKASISRCSAFFVTQLSHLWASWWLR